MRTLLKNLFAFLLLVPLLAFGQSSVGGNGNGAQSGSINPAGNGTVTSFTLTVPIGMTINSGQSQTITTTGTLTPTFNGSANQIPTSNGSGGLNWTSATMSTNGNTLTFAGGSNLVDNGSGALTVQSKSGVGAVLNLTSDTAIVIPASVNMEWGTTNQAGLRGTTGGASSFTFFTNGVNTLVLSGAAAATLTGGAGNMTIVAGTGNSRTMTLQTTNSGGTATNAIVIDATQTCTFSNKISSFGQIVSSSSAGGVGYQTGAGNAVTQLTSRTTAVTSNTVTGQITLVSAAGSSTPTTFAVGATTAIGADDVVVITQKSGSDKYLAYCTGVTSGTGWNFTVEDRSGTTTEAPVFNYTIIKGSHN